jgi:signal transduction histidine kinase
MMMSHELRTPLNAVIGFAELMTGEPFGPMGDERYRDYLNDIRTSGVQLLAMIDMILEVIRLDSRDVATHDVAFEIAGVVTECCTAMEAEAEAKTVRLEYGVATALPHFLGDARLMRQVLICLLSNAIKFTDTGGHVGLSVDCGPDGDLTIAVTDDGVGMTEAELERAAILLQQGGGGMVRRHGGVGIGLTLAKLATEKQGGRIELDSIVGRGTVVRVKFPSSRLRGSDGAAPPARPDAGHREAGRRLL